MRVATLFAIVTILSSACLPMMNPGAAGQGAFTGTFQTQGGTISLQESGGQVAGTMQGGGVTGQITGFVSNGVLSGQVRMSNGETANFTATPTADGGLSVAVPGRGAIAFTRSTGAAAPGAAGTVDPSIAPSSQIADTLAGVWWHYHSTGSGDSSASYERTIELCRDGRFFDSSNSDISVTAKSNAEGVDGWGNTYRGSEMTAGQYSQDAGAGRWTASGDDMTGQIQLTFNNGQVEAHQYKFEKRGGGDIYFDDRWYGYDTKKAGQCQ